jgi:hypothetical protein
MVYSWQGKRGGIRVIYYWHLAGESIYRLYVFKKKRAGRSDKKAASGVKRICKKRCAMKDREFADLLKSIDQAREIHAKRMKPSRVFTFNPLVGLMCGKSLAYPSPDLLK